jgi:hypothetical protein
MGSGWRGPMRYKKAQPQEMAGGRASCSPGSPSLRSLGVRPVVGTMRATGSGQGSGTGDGAEAVGMTMDAGTGHRTHNKPRRKDTCSQSCEPTT